MNSLNMDLNRVELSGYRLHIFVLFYLLDMNVKVDNVQIKFIIIFNIIKYRFRLDIDFKWILILFPIVLKEIGNDFLFTIERPFHCTKILIILYFNTRKQRYNFLKPDLGCLIPY